MSFWRGLALVLLGLGVAGFGLCSLCGGVMGLSMLSGNTRDAQFASTAFVAGALGAVAAALCWWGVRKLRRKPVDAQALASPGPSADTPAPAPAAHDEPPGPAA